MDAGFVNKHDMEKIRVVTIGGLVDLSMMPSDPDENGWGVVLNRTEAATLSVLLRRASEEPQV